MSIQTVKAGWASERVWAARNGLSEGGEGSPRGMSSLAESDNKEAM